MKMRVIIGIFFSVAILVCIIGGLWFVGHKKQTATEDEQAKLLDEVIARQKNLHQLVINKINTGENFDGFDSSDLGKAFTPTDIKTYPPKNGEAGRASAEEATAYSIALAEAFKPANLSLNRPLRTLLAFYDTGNSNTVLELKETAAAHLKSLSTLANLTVPTDAAVLQLRLLNSMREITSALTAMSNVEKEPLQAAQAAQQYPQFFSHLTDAMAYGNKYFTNNGVKFTTVNSIKVELSQ